MPVYIARGLLTAKAKIGCSKNPAARMRTLESSHGESFELLRTIDGNLETELWLLHYFAALRRHGREWFTFSPSMLTVQPPTGFPERIPHHWRDGPLPPDQRLSARIAELQAIRDSARAARSLQAS